MESMKARMENPEKILKNGPFYIEQISRNCDDVFCYFILEKIIFQV